MLAVSDFLSGTLPERCALFWLGLNRLSKLQVYCEVSACYRDRCTASRGPVKRSSINRMAIQVTHTQYRKLNLSTETRFFFIIDSMNTKYMYK